MFRQMAVYQATVVSGGGYIFCGKRKEASQRSSYGCRRAPSAHDRQQRIAWLFAIRVGSYCELEPNALNGGADIGLRAKAMLRLARDRDLRCSMGEAGQRRVEEHFRWDRKAEQISHLYEQFGKPRI